MVGFMIHNRNNTPRTTPRQPITIFIVRRDTVMVTLQISTVKKGELKYVSVLVQRVLTWEKRRVSVCGNINVCEFSIVNVCEGA